MKILCLTHADFETPGAVSDWALTQGYALTVCKPYQQEKIPAMLDFDLLIVMGGPQSARYLAQTPYLFDEVQCIKTAIAQNKKVLGFCLGAQLIGVALGAQALQSPEKEVGIYSITLTEKGLLDPLLKNLPRSFPVIHWHNDMPGLLEDSEVLATSAGCPRQIIRYQPGVYGFQCHLEIDREGAQALIDACPEDFAPSLFTQPVDALLSQDFAAINQMMHQLLNQWVSLSNRE